MNQQAVVFHSDYLIQGVLLHLLFLFTIPFACGVYGLFLSFASRKTVPHKHRLQMGIAGVIILCSFLIHTLAVTLLDLFHLEATVTQSSIQYQTASDIIIISLSEIVSVECISKPKYGKSYLLVVTTDSMKSELDFRYMEPLASCKMAQEIANRENMMGHSSLYYGKYVR